ncbi:MAG: DegT/DnrJ/EryC1/StrS family aminotransferase [Candidatus Krumholzibacteria bacterium]|nr:DegT/DnrJ/EryC1/StrS family aminotransferase [Candidatus Krumholzibacteria bacterium]MDH4337098.1 DegT/DnrJ/EryC1/StrS family aminotransferase [Candidatus Krumholzibacteria bacterium]MDH5268635.1 DegT/DnrJ/EryC1/StrS family aminotransferase [Candidatus Krumholzibacteria bacterium]MDH5627215.1 DegT/DnrJ/EryC1/StrS family aminotransferase [Candidatus Krumholzibacteria bacterium]
MQDKPVRPRDRFLVFGAPQIEQAEIDEVVDSIRSGWLGTGPKVARFEDDFKQYKGAPHAAAVHSCTAALHLAMLASGVGEGDEVITTPLTFCASVNAIIHTGATPVLADVDPRSMNIDPAHIEEKITPRTKAIMPVHFAGRPCDMDAIMKIAEKRGLMVIEDCAHAIEARYKGKEAGLFGQFGCFSFYVTKNVITGEGGMVLAHDEALAARIKVLALHGMSKDAWKRFSDSGWVHYQVVEAGFKYNMMDIQAAIGIHQLRRVEPNWLLRKEIWDRYNEAFAHFPIGVPCEPDEDTRHALHLYTIMVAKGRSGISRDDFLSAVQAQNVGVGVHYLSVPEHPYYQARFGWKPEEFPSAMRIGRETVSLPLSPRLSDADVADVIEAVRRVVER